MSSEDVRLDWQRSDRLGISEAIWGLHKTVDQIVAILEAFAARDQPALVTRVDETKAKAVLERCNTQLVHFEARARCLTSGTPPPLRPELGNVTVLSGGTSDLPIAAEAQLALHWHGIDADLLLDVGVAGLHRLLDQLPKLQQSSVLIACAGMEGALPTVLAGLLPQPVIGVPVSVGYGVSAGGRAALDGMLASCAPGLAVVNIDNGYGAAMAALRILQRST